MVENVAGGLARRGGPHAASSATASTPAARRGPGHRRTATSELWEMLHDEPDRGRLGDERPVDVPAAPAQRARASRSTRSASSRPTTSRRPAAHAGRRGRTAASTPTSCARLTGLDVGEGQARILLDDLRGPPGADAERAGAPVPEAVAARAWLLEVFSPGAERAHCGGAGRGDPIQAYCDLLEVRWLLSEQAGHDVGDEPALEALARSAHPGRLGRRSWPSWNCRPRSCPPLSSRATTEAEREDPRERPTTMAADGGRIGIVRPGRAWGNRT